jgi:mRNA interferase RelE/StbE
MGEIYFIRAVVEDDLRHIGRPDIPAIFKKLTLLETDVHAGPPLGGDLTGFRRLVVGRNTYRIVYRIRDAVIEVCEVWAVGQRRNDEVYTEATRRVRMAADARPELLSLAELMATIAGMDSSVLSRPATPAPDPVPEWLYKQLVHTAGLAPHDVAAMTGEEAFAAWNAWMTRTR